MRLRWRRSLNSEDRLEQWIAQQHQRRVLAGDTTPEGPCPEDDFLRDIVRRSASISLSDPRVDHAALCSACVSRILVLRQEELSRRRIMIGVAAVSCCLILLVGFFALKQTRRRSPATENAVAVSQTVNLWDAETVRGERPGQLQSVSLPAALINLTIVLPHHSVTGKYLIAITRDQNGNGVLAEGVAPSTPNGDTEQIMTTIDLREAQAGQYFLSTTHEQDQASYYYPLQIK